MDSRLVFLRPLGLRLTGTTPQIGYLIYGNNVYSDIDEKLNNLAIRQNDEFRLEVTNHTTGLSAKTDFKIRLLENRLDPL